MLLNKQKVVAIGGGHGLGRVLSTLSFLENQLTGIVTTTDNGGSTGRLRKRHSSIAWGDLRNCLMQLVDKNSIGSQLFNYRFDGQDELGGHNLGNLILYTLGQIQSRPLDSIKLVRRLLKVKTAVLPMSETPTDLMAFYPQGRCRVGELSVDEMAIMPEKLMLAPLVKTLDNCLNAIKEADLIILGPGSFLTSVIPPLLVREISKGILASKAHCVFIDNIAQEQSPAGKLSLDEKLTWIENNIGFQPINTVITANKHATSAKASIIQAELANERIKHYHDSDKLVNALELCLSANEEQQNIINS